MNTTNPSANTATGNSWAESFVRDGFFHFPGLIDGQTIAAARNRIDRDLAENFDPARQVEYDNRSFCPDIRGSAEIVALLNHPATQARIASLVDLNSVDFDPGQIAIRKAHNADRPYPPHAHIDGIPTATNGVGGDELCPFTMLVAVFLSEVTAEFAGNFTVWPGSHLLIESYFRQRGPIAFREGMPPVPLGAPMQLTGSPGDVVLCHYQLAHAAAVNLSESDRYAVFFRVRQHSFSRAAGETYRRNAWHHLTNIWTGWKVGP